MAYLGLVFCVLYYTLKCAASIGAESMVLWELWCGLLKSLTTVFYHVASLVPFVGWAMTKLSEEIMIG